MKPHTLFLHLPMSSNGEGGESDVAEVKVARIGFLMRRLVQKGILLEDR
jgi:hypothetical protein